MTHYSGAVLCGNLFLESDIGGGKNVAPAVVYGEANVDKYYTIVMIDPVSLLFVLYFVNPSLPGPRANHKINIEMN